METGDEPCLAYLPLGGEIPSALPVSVSGSVLTVLSMPKTELSPTDEGPGSSDLELS